MEQSKSQCVVCKKVAELKCYCRTRYCSKTCQKADWKEHKKVCKDKHDERVVKKIVNVLEKTKYIGHCFWKKTACPLVITDSEKVDKIKETALSFVKSLYENPSKIDKNIKERVMHLDEMEKRLSDFDKKKEKHNFTKEEGLSWWLSVAILQELNFIKEDKDNSIVEITLTKISP